jgi:hypothetical protein
MYVCLTTSLVALLTVFSFLLDRPPYAPVVRKIQNNKNPLTLVAITCMPEYASLNLLELRLEEDVLQESTGGSAGCEQEVQNMRRNRRKRATGSNCSRSRNAANIFAGDPADRQRAGNIDAPVRDPSCDAET